MKRKIYLTICMLAVALFVSAQPKARRQQQRQSQNDITERAKIMFPTAETMPADVVWRRDVYREIDLTTDANAGLYYPTEPVGGQMNLFTYIFRLMMSGRVPAYKYDLDGKENFTQANRVKPMDFLKDYHIFYETVNGRVRIDNSDIPSADVKAYYIKECSYYDQNTATFHTQVIALCPIMERQDDFGDGSSRYPLFWVRYSDLAPFLSRQQMVTSNLNNAAVMSVEDFFDMSLYRGKIYKTTNMLGQTLAQYCKNDSAIGKEQQRIENEIIAFEKNIWGDRARQDSLDSIAAAKADTMAVKSGKKKRSRQRTSAESSKTSIRKSRRRSDSDRSSSTKGQARVTVRRQRH